MRLVDEPFPRCPTCGQLPDWMSARKVCCHHGHIWTNYVDGRTRQARELRAARLGALLNADGMMLSSIDKEPGA